MSIVNKYLRNSTNSYNNKLASTSTSLTSTLPPISQQPFSSTLINETALNRNNKYHHKTVTNRMIKPFEFKPLGDVEMTTTTSTTTGNSSGRPLNSRLSAKFGQLSSEAASKSDNLINSLIHTTSKIGKVAKRKEKTVNKNKYSNIGLLEVNY